MAVSESKDCWVYIAELGDTRLFVGVMISPNRRTLEHQDGRSSRTTRIFGLKRMLYLEPQPNLLSARQREKQLKGWSRAKKLALASGNLRALKELSRSKKMVAMKRQDRAEAYAVVRIDDFHGPETPLEHKITVKEILSKLEAAKSEVERLNQLNQEKGCRYFWQPTRLVGFFPERKV